MSTVICRVVICRVTLLSLNGGSCDPFSIKTRVRDAQNHARCEQKRCTLCHPVLPDQGVVRLG